MKERKLGNFLVGSLKMISFRLSRERNRKIGLNIEKTVVNVKSNKHFWKAVRTKATRSKLTRIGRVWLVEEKVSTLDHIYIYIYRVVQSLRNLEIEVVAVSNTRTFLPAKRNLEETCPILSIFRGELWAITTPSSPLLISLSHTHGLFATFVWYTKLATIFPATTVSIRFGACLGCTIRRDIDRMSVTSDITRRSSRTPRDRA